MCNDILENQILREVLFTQSELDSIEVSRLERVCQLTSRKHALYALKHVFLGKAEEVLRSGIRIDDDLTRLSTRETDSNS